MSDWICEDCGLELFWPLAYMLRDEVWLQVKDSADGHVCVFCFEVRLGRPLAGADFTDCALNDAIEERLLWMREEGHAYWLAWARKRREQLDRRNRRARERRREQKAVAG